MEWITIVATWVEKYLKIKYSRKKGDKKKHRNQRGRLLRFKTKKRGQLRTLPRSIMWTKS